MRALLFTMFAGLMISFGASAENASITAVSQLDQNDPLTWLVKSVCVDSLNQVLRRDPYGGCPFGASIRKIQIGDPLPYHNIEQIGYQQRDAFPVADVSGTKTWIVNTFDYAPFNFFNLYATANAGSDGYDVITVQDGWASVANTSDGGGYGQAFYGSNCRLGDGWILFPANGFLSANRATVAIADAYWEQSDQSYPGACPSKYSTSTQTSWKKQSAFKFGGVNGNPTKTMDTLVSYHGFQSSLNFLFHENLEVFYFTREYGMTRWEVWTPAVQNPKQANECVTPSTQNYNNVTFVVTACHDWSVVTPPPSGSEQIPVWPIPNINLLQNPHFISTTAPWIVADGITAIPKVSSSYRDTLFAKPGVGYVSLTCGTNCITSADNFQVSLYQDLPATNFVPSQTYSYGINVRTDPAQCAAPCDGSIGVKVNQFDAVGNLLSSVWTIGTVTSDNGTPGASTGEADSVYLSSAFISGSVTIVPGVQLIRIRIAPKSPETFDVVSAWLGPWPASSVWP